MNGRAARVSIVSFIISRPDGPTSKGSTILCTCTPLLEGEEPVVERGQLPTFMRFNQF